MFSAMKITFAILVLVAPVQAESNDDYMTILAQTDSKVTPVQKVIELMEGMVAKGKKEKHEEAVAHAAFAQFCTDEQAAKKSAIEEANDLIAVLKADIEKGAADIEQLGIEIKEHEEEIAAKTADVKAAQKVRDTERAEYEATHQDMSESIDALERAIAVISKQKGDIPQFLQDKHSFAQVESVTKIQLIPDDAKRAIAAFLAQDPDDALAVSAPEANAYEFQSQGIIDLLQKFLDKFTDERTALEKEEANKRHAFGMLKSDLESDIENNEAAKNEKTETKATKEENKAKDESDLEDTTKTRDDDQKYLDDLITTCEEKTAEFNSRQTLRAEEIVAIEKAIEIIGGEAVAGAADKHLPGALTQTATALAQLRSNEHSPTQKRVAAYLQEQAKSLNSRLLSAVAARVAADPFKKIKKMIKDLITKLMEEANAEAEHKGYCDAELATNAAVRKEKTEAVEALTAEMDELEASISKLTEQIGELTKAVADLDAAVAKATKIREDEKAKNAATVEDAKEAQKAVAQALQVLKDFYEKAGDAGFKGQSGSSGGVIGMIEVIQSDFERLEADTKAAETAAQAEYDKFMTDAEVDKAAKTTDIEHKTKKKQDQDQQLKEKNTDLVGTQEELDAALAYYEKLKPACVDEGISYEDRVQMRKEEIQSLQEALKILSGADIA